MPVCEKWQLSCFSIKTASHRLHIGGKWKRKEKKAALPNPRVFHTETLLHTLSTKCMKRLLRQQIYLHTFVHVNSSEVNTHMQTYSPQCTIHWVAIFVHTSRASLLTILFGKFCICVQIQDTDTLHFTKTMFSLQVFLAEDKWQYYGILKWGDGRLKGLLKDICTEQFGLSSFVLWNTWKNWWSHLTLRAKMSNAASQNLVSNPLLANDPPPPTLTPPSLD